MNLVKWNPWREMETFSDRINRFFEGSVFPATLMGEESSMTNWKPVADIFDREDKIVIRADLPGVDKKDIHVDLKDNILTLEGERSDEIDAFDLVVNSFLRKVIAKVQPGGEQDAK